MKYFLSEKNLLLLEAFTFTKVLYAFDYDGTLAKIVPNPHQAFMNQRTTKLLVELAKKAPVAVVSGRGVEDLKKRVPKEIRLLIGNHGLESNHPQTSSLKRAEKITDQWREILLPALEAHFPAVDLEDKTYSLTLHYRRSRKKKQTKKALTDFVQTLPEAPRVIHGKEVLNLVPQGAPHKGMALCQLLMETQVAKALYIGDDETDEDVFCLNDNRILGVHVGKKKSTQAPYYLQDQSEINHVLQKLIELQAPDSEPHG